jgi:hypothetical protein
MAALCEVRRSVPEIGGARQRRLIRMGGAGRGACRARRSFDSVHRINRQRAFFFRRAKQQQ